MASGTRQKYQAYEGVDVSIVIDQQGVIRYKKSGVKQSEIKAVIDGLLATSIEENKGRQRPREFELNQNFPNPFNPATVISFSLPEKDYITLDVFNIVGQKVITLLSGETAAGSHQVNFYGAGFSSGVYFYQLRGRRFSSIKRMVLAK